MGQFHHAILLFSNFPESDSVEHFCVDAEVVDSFQEKVGVDDARRLVQLAHGRPVEKSERLLVVRSNFITHEAQNALLKVLEEPPVSTRFLFVLPEDASLLPTLRSRFSLESLVGEGVADNNDHFQAFAQSGYAERIASIDEAVKKKNLSWQRDIKTGLIELLSRPGAIDQEQFVALEYVARTLLTRGASNKMLLEQAALTLPTETV